MMKLKMLLAWSLWLLTFQSDVFAQPDLTITNVVAPSFGEVNDIFNISCHVKNIGNREAFFDAFAGNVATVTLISTVSGVPEPNLPFFSIISRSKFFTLRSRYDSLVTLSFRLPYTMTAGDYILRLSADPSNSIAETNEANNVVNLPITIRAATMDNRQLKIINVTGDNRVEPNGTLTTSVTIKNSSHLRTYPDYLFLSKWHALPSSVPTQYHMYTFADNIEAYQTGIIVPSIPPNQTITIPVTFTMPTMLMSDAMMRIDSRFQDVLAPYVTLGSTLTDPAYLYHHADNLESVKQSGYYFPIKPASTTDLALSGSSLTPTWDSINHTIELRLRVTNNGTKTAKNVVVEVSKELAPPTSEPVTALSKKSGNGVALKFYAKDSSFTRWNITEIAPGASVEALFSGSIEAQYNQPQSIQAYYHDVKIMPRIWHADVNDPVRANDTINGGITYKLVRVPSVPPVIPPYIDLTLANLQLASRTIAQGQTLYYKVDIKNIGTAAVPTGSYIGLASYLSNDTTLTADDINFGGSMGYGINGMSLNATIPQFGSGLVDRLLEAKQYYLIVQVLANNSTESNTRNNTIVLPLTVTAVCALEFPLASYGNTCQKGVKVSGISGSLKMYKASPVEGVRMSIHDVNHFDTNYQLYTGTGTATPPAGALFRNCAGNWLYYTGYGMAKDAQAEYNFTNIPLRICYYGTLTNPDSVLVEIATNAPKIGLLNPSNPFWSTNKIRNCGTCSNNDNQTPSFLNCPTSPVVYELTEPSFVRTDDLLSRFSIYPTDDCAMFKAVNPVKYHFSTNYNITAEIYDSVGNHSACKFVLRTSDAPLPCAAFTPPVFLNCPSDITVTAANQTCRIVTWVPPTIAKAGSPNPVQVTSNIAVGACFPVGVTRVIYTATDSCQNTSTCAFNVTFKSTIGENYCAALSTTPWDLWISRVQFNFLDNMSVQFKDLKTMGYSNYTNLSASVTKGQRYALDVTPGLSWIGNLPNVYCSVWIDFNNNKIFEDREMVLLQKNANPLISNVLIPSTAVSGKVQMRVAVKLGSYPTACEAFEKGEVEDYTIQIENATHTVADIALSATTTPSTYQKYSTNTVKIIAQNTGNQDFTNVTIEFPFPAKTVTGGSIIPSVGSWKEWCTGGAHCFLWTIPSLAANRTATLEVPIFVLDATGTITATAQLLRSTPLDDNLNNNKVSISLVPAVPTVTQARTRKATEHVPILIKTLMPSPTEGDLVVELESFKSKTVRFDFYNLMGKVVKTETRAVESGNNQLLFDFWEAASGVYFLQTSDGTGNNAPLKFVKW